MENFLKKSTVTNIAEFDKQSEDFLSNVPLETAIAASHKLLIIAADLPHGDKAVQYILNSTAFAFTIKGIKFDFLLFCNSLLDNSDFDSPKIKYPLYAMMGSYYYSMSNYAEAKFYFEKSLKVDIKDGTSFIINTYTSLGLIDIRNLDYENAFKNLTIALNIAQNLQDTIWIALSNGNIGFLYKKMGNYDNAVNYLRKDVALSIQKTHPSAANALTSIAECYILNNKLDAAKKVMDSALNLFKTINGNIKYPATIQFYNLQSDYYQRKSNFKEAYHYLQIVTTLTDSVNEQNIQKSLALNLAKINADKQQQKKILLNTTIYNKKKNEILFFIVILSILVALVFASLLLKQKNKLNRILKEKNTLVSKQKEQAENKRNDLQQSNEHKSKLLSIIAHDLKTPINNLQGLLQMLESGIISYEELAEHLPSVQQKVDTLYGTIDNLLNWTFSQLNNISTQPTTVQISKITQTVFNFLQPIAEEKKIELVNQISAPTYAFCDANQFEIIVRNLVSNAIKFSPENSKVIVEAKIEKKHVHINIIDFGIGISPATMDVLFSPQNQISTYGTKGEKGVGLGLIICKEFAHNNGGEIFASANNPTGTIMHLTLPTNTSIA
ncbi:MAG: tetratricopeptide repeat-containing sensor histidine kinase [Chitinophagaceae bacterium]